MNSFDTNRFSIIYDKNELVEAKYTFNEALNIRALSRHSRDMIALSIKCFSAKNFMQNSALIK